MTQNMFNVMIIIVMSILMVELFRINILYKHMSNDIIKLLGALGIMISNSIDNEMTVTVVKKGINEE